jgi:adenosylcobinamide kinase/adenosylcobinamide-phosphate guanylyltransferase
LPRTTLVLGGARSGKSRYAQSLAEAEPGDRVYIATAEAGDAEMAERIRRHREARGGRWRTVEAPLALAEALTRAAGRDRVVVVDCLTLWLANLMAAGRDVAAETENLVAALGAVAGPAVLVSNEVGHGIVPEAALARAFRDHAGELHQAVAAASGRVVMVTAGLAHVLKDTNTETGR